MVAVIFLKTTFPFNRSLGGLRAGSKQEITGKDESPWKSEMASCQSTLGCL